MNETAFNDWWNASYDAVDNPFEPETPAWWAWAAWQAATKIEREARATVCDKYDAADPLGVSLECANAIRARSED